MKLSMLFVAFSLVSTSFAAPFNGEDLYVPGLSLHPAAKHELSALNRNTAQYTVINYDYHKILHQSNQLLQAYFQRQKVYGVNSDHDGHVFESVLNFFENANIPYIFSGAIGEGECKRYDESCLRIQQDLPYRLDGLDCMTFVQDVLALVQSNSLTAFQTHLQAINYGAYDQTKTKSYLNRNNFTSSDFNRVNQQSGLITDVTAYGPFSNFIDYLPEKVIDHKTWFENKAQPQNIQSNIRVLPQYEDNADEIVARFTNGYADDFAKIDIEKFSYIPKEALVRKVGSDYQPNEVLLNQLITPSVVEFVREDSKWLIAGKPISEVIGSNLIVSHMGILYKASFSQHEIIYQNIQCDYNPSGQKQCIVTPVICDQKRCDKVMLMAASSAYPNGFIYSKKNGAEQYACTPENEIPKGYQSLRNKISNEPVTCNRVFSMPLGEYLASKQYGKYPYMESESLVGVSIQKINI
ncbi:MULTISPECIES: N-acetylmuramoyl-L-alanine amidase-like domain-containing protein [Cysteiniphilum]|uniref:N-acetylmuramoyl-L-alanine amidase-like domain-containing protein n=1 Tax=Cysteiniphilum TaxID=2056696 RepID=UPI001780D1A2|nr:MULTISPECIES: N-acetylmuramoyl-L-alanine amidase-like domain-containing protein [Cysteiniphilum]